MKNPLITVVVPMYNVQNYIRDCVRSIQYQTYRNLEIILVDDGSPDDCGKIAEGLAEDDERIKVIHQLNKGLSEARNVAIDIAKGKYITFVDGDDYIENTMIYELYNVMQQHHAQIAVTGLRCVYENGKFEQNHQGEKCCVYTTEQALDCFLFNEYMTPCVCGKLYEIVLWKGIRCPAGRLHEDQFTTYKLIDCAQKVAYLTCPKYYYRQRYGSIGHSKFSEKSYDLYEGINEEYEYISKKYGEKCPNIAVGKITWEIVFANSMIMSGYKDKVLIRSIRQFAIENKRFVARCPYISTIRKGQIFLFSYLFALYTLFYRIFKICKTLKFSGGTRSDYT